MSSSVDLVQQFAPNAVAIWVTALVFIYSVVATIVIPGKRVKGVQLKDGSHVLYKINASPVHICSMLVAWLFSDYGFFNLYPLAIVVDNYKPLMGTLFLVSVAAGLFLYVRALFFIRKEQQNWVYPLNPLFNFWCGGELNPHFFGFEIKEWSYRPGFVLGTLVDISALARQYELYGTITTPMLLFQFVVMFYCIDAFIYERGLITMFDIIEENYGFMLTFGDYCWIPMIYSIQSVYLIHEHTIPAWYIVLTLVTFFGGYAIFRGANNQKIQFKNDPTKPIWGKKPETIKTDRKTELLVSGYWGIARKANYLGDLLVALSISMPCQTVSIVPYIYPLYLFALLCHRAYRDNERCAKKYGRYWEEYCKRVPYIIIPYVF